MEDPNTSGDKTNKPKPGHRQRIRESDHIKLLQHRIEAKGIPRTVMKVLTIFRGKKRQWLCLTGHSIVLGNTTMFLLSALQFSAATISKISHISEIIDLSSFSPFPSFQIS